MPSYRSFIGDRNAPGFLWEGSDDAGFNTGNTPPRLVPREFHLDLAFSHRWYESHAASGRFPARQLDWGAWAIEVSKTECLGIWDDVRETRRAENWEAIRAQIEALPDDRQYVIVVMELA